MRSSIVPVLPPASLPSDSSQIHSLISEFCQAVQRNDGQRIKALIQESTDSIESIAKEASNNIPLIHQITLSDIKLNEASASIKCALNDSLGNNAGFITILAEKVGVTWRIRETSEIKKLINSVPHQSALFSANQIASTSIVDIPGTLLIQKHPLSVESHNVYLLNQNYISSQVQKEYLARGTKIDIEGLYYNSNDNEGVVFYLDPIVKRIVYAGPGWIKSYGDHDGDFRFTQPVAMAVDILDTLYIADQGENCIIKLFFTAGPNFVLQYASKMRIPGISLPVDIAVDQAGSLTPTQPPYQQKGSDILWVADDFNRKIVGTYRNGTVYKTLTQYSVGYVSYNLGGVFRIQAHDDGRLGLIDRYRNAFVVINPTSGAADYSTEFPQSSSRLTSIGIDINNEWWVGDAGQCKYHKFDRYGRYLASYSNDGQLGGGFSWPIAVSKAPYTFSGGTLKRSPYVYTADPWGPNTGTRTFVPWANIIEQWPSISKGFSGIIQVGFTLTNKAHYRVTLYKHDNPTPIKQYGDQVAEAGYRTFDISRFFCGHETYDVKVELAPGYWNSIPGNQYPVEKTQSFTLNPDEIELPIGYISLLGNQWTINPNYEGSVL